VIDFIGIFDKLEKALAFDSDDVKSVIRDCIGSDGNGISELINKGKNASSSLNN